MSPSDNTNGTTELSRQWEYVHDVIIPRLHPGQRVLLVPGLFASDPVHCLLHDNVTCPLDQQEAQVLTKLQGYIAWMKVPCAQLRQNTLLPCRVIATLLTLR